MSGATASKDSKVKDGNNLHMYVTDLLVVLYLFLNIVRLLQWTTSF